MKLDGYSNSDAVAFDFQMIITTISIWRLHAYYTRIYIYIIYIYTLHYTNYMYTLYIYIYVCVCCLITLTLSHVSHPTCLPISGISEGITGRTKAVLGSAPWTTSSRPRGFSLSWPPRATHAWDCWSHICWVLRQGLGDVKMLHS